MNNVSLVLLLFEHQWVDLSARQRSLDEKYRKQPDHLFEAIKEIRSSQRLSSLFVFAQSTRTKTKLFVQKIPTVCTFTLV